MILFALCDYLAKANYNPDAKNELSFTLNGKQAGDVKFDDKLTKKIVIDGSELKNGDNKLTFKTEMTGVMYRVVLRYWKTGRDIEPMDKGIKVARKFHLWDEKTKQIEKELKNGDTVAARLLRRLRRDGDVRHARRDAVHADGVPEAEHGRDHPGGRSAVRQRAAEHGLRPARGAAWRRWRSTTSRRGRSITNRVVMLAELAGDYVVPPAFVELMYQTEVRGHSGTFALKVTDENQTKLGRFLENHDEPRAAATFSLEVHQAAAVITFLSPGLRFFHQGQFEGRRKRISPHLVRGPNEPVDEKLKAFYDRLLAVLRQPTVREGQWQLLECSPAWEGNWTNDCFLVFAWQGTKSESLVVAVNYSPNQSQCHVRLPFADLAGKKWRLQDQLSPASYEWNGDDLSGRGLFLDMAPWQACVFSMSRSTG